MAETVFPAFLRAQYQDDAGGFPAFQRAAESAAQGARRSFEANLSQIQSTIERAVAMPRNAGGSLDLGVPQLREAASASEARALAAREVAVAVRAAAAAEGDYSAEARQAVAASEAVAREHEQAAAAARQLAVAHEQVQAQLNRTASGTQAVIAPTRGLALAQNDLQRTFGAQRQASVQLGQQLQDIVISLDSGMRASMVFAQQIPQAAFALSGLEGSTNKSLSRLGAFATFLSGPWGAAFAIGLVALGPFIDGLFKSGEAADVAKAGADGLASAQSSLGGIFDLTTGKIKAQNEILLVNARLQAITLRADAIKKQKAFDDAATVAGRSSLFTSFGLGSAPGAIEGVSYGDLTANARGMLGQVRSGKLKPSDALRQSERINLQGSAITRAQLQQAIVDIATAQSSKMAADLIDQSLNSGKLASGLMQRGKPKKPPKPKSGAAAARAAERSEEYGEDTRDKIARITEQFSDQPPVIRQVSDATRQLNDIIDDLSRKKPPNFQSLIDQANAAKTAVQDGLTKPMQDYLRAAEERRAIDDAMAAGGEDWASALQDALGIQRQMGPLSAAQRDHVLATVAAERQRSAVLRDQRALIEGNLDAVMDMRQGIEATVADALRGRASLGNLVERVQDSYANLVAKSFTENIFGDAFRELENEILGANKVQTAADLTAGALGTAGDAAERFAEILDSVTRRTSAANDNALAPRVGKSGRLDGLLDDLFGLGSLPAATGEDEIVVTGKRPRAGLAAALDPTVLYERMFTRGFKLAGLSEEASSKLGKVFGKSLEGGAYGSMIGGLIGGPQGARTGQAIGTIFGGISEIGNATKIGGAVGKLTKAAGVIGTAFEIGTAIGTLFGSKQNIAKATITSVSEKQWATGNDVNAANAVKSTVDSVQSTLQKVLDAFGAEAGAFSVSIGKWNDYYRVSASGSSRVTDKRYPDGAGADLLYDGQSAEDAVRAAVLNAIQDGAVQGIRAGAQRLLQAGRDIESAVNKALKFENVFTRLKQETDPVGAAIDALNKEFKGLRKIFQEAGASAQEWADLEKLYGIERTKAVKQATEEMTSAYKSLLEQLTTGDNGRSLRDRQAAALGIYNPLASDLAAGRNVDPNAFTDAARTLLDIERQLYGSQPEYFKLQDDVIALLKQALGSADAAIAAAGENLFPKSGEPIMTSGNAPVVSAIDAQTAALAAILTGQLNAVNDNLGALIEQASLGAGRVGNSMSPFGYGGF